MCCFVCWAWPNQRWSFGKNVRPLQATHEVIIAFFLVISISSTSNLSSTSVSQSSKKLCSLWLVRLAGLCSSPPLLSSADNIKTSLLKKPNKCLGQPKLAANTTSHVHIFVDGERHHNKNKRLCGTGKYAIFRNRRVGDTMSVVSDSRSFVSLFSCLLEFHRAVYPLSTPKCGTGRIF